jgi:hypothetical protein
MRDSSSKAWFAAKRYGVGSGLPIAWQGWLVLALFLAAIAVAIGMLHGTVQLALILSATAVFVIICACTTEGGWRWRNGD